ncbi:MAG TPA: TMEM14 family protein [Chthoniobacteraceae bacterium]|jgi:uncharacterized membrane protein (UPF0136 family)|nr:TMEM14 family protein [Chthoniobacteraceae bacterium]
MIELTKYYYFLFGLMTIAGGVMGYVKAQSKASLIAGGISGLLLLTAGVLVSMKVLPAALILGLVVSLALAFKFIPNFLANRKFMPGGLMSVLSVIGAILSAVALFTAT